MKKGKMSKTKIIILSVTALIVIPIVAYLSYFAYILYFRETPTIVNTTPGSIIDEVDRPADLPTPEESGIDNIVLFGVDSRTANYHGRTDSIIIASPHFHGWHRC
jgi:anionic cell wall polymer biosynthesis LytR-Cps2A-Psr (LCP) family protein